MGRMERLSDEELIERSRAERGSPKAAAFLNELFERHHAKVAGWCLRITGEMNSATDLAQEVFLKAFQRLNSFQGNAKFTTWLFAITRNHCLDELRSKEMRSQDSRDVLPEEIADFGREGVSSALERRQSEELLRTLMRESLDEMENKVLTLHYVNELPLDAVGRMLGLTNRSGAKAYIVSARRKLKRAHARWKARQPQAMKGGRGVE
jgi:RNA polymerase sigma-70 factor (ECF subfamily)